MNDSNPPLKLKNYSKYGYAINSDICNEFNMIESTQSYKLYVTYFGNDDKRISTVVYVFNCHPDNVEVLKIILKLTSSIETDQLTMIVFMLYPKVLYNTQPILFTNNRYFSIITSTINSLSFKSIILILMLCTLTSFLH